MPKIEAQPAFGGREVIAPLHDLQWHPRLTAHDLQRFRQAVPRECSAQRGVAAQQLLPRLAEARDVDRAAQAARELLHIQIAGFVRYAVEQHALLHRRERIDILFMWAHASSSNRT